MKKPDLSNIKIEKVTTVSGDVPIGVESILQDSDGLIWVGAQSGFYRYDGLKFKKLLDVTVMSIYELSNGNLILFSFNRMTEYDRVTETFQLVSVIQSMTAVQEDSNGNIWLASRSTGLYKLDKYKNIISKFEEDPKNCFKTINSNRIECLNYDKETDKLYIGTRKGLNTLDIKSETFSYYCVQDNENSDKSNSIGNMFRDSRNVLWMCTHDGLFTFNEKNNCLERFVLTDSNEVFADTSINCICEDDDGFIWSGTRRRELVCFDFITKKYDNLKLTNVEGTLIYLKNINSNVIFIGVDGDYTLKIDRQLKKFYNLTKLKPSQIVNIATDSENNILYSFYSAPLYKGKLNGSIFNSEKVSEFKDKLVFRFSSDINNNFWISCRQEEDCQIIVADNNLKNFTIYDLEGINGLNNNISAQFNDSNPDCIWLGFKISGLFKFDKSKNNLIDYSPIINQPNIFITSLFLDSNNFLWIGSEQHGLFKFDTENSKVFKYDLCMGKDEFTSYEMICCFAEDNYKNMWIGTESSLYKIYSDIDKIERYTKKDGLSDDYISGILIDDSDNLWISSRNGLTKFNPHNKIIKNFYESDGLDFNTFHEESCHKSKDGKFFFGSRAITYFYPSEIKDNIFIPNIILTDFQIFNKSVIPSAENPYLKTSITHTKHINLTYRESVISFEFSALVYNDPFKNQYAYKMDGFDDHWVFCGTRRITTYTNLDPGEYTFRVKGSNNNGNWNEEGTSVKITITPPWWETWWFKTGGTALALISAGFVYKKSIDKLKNEKKAQEEFSKKLINSQEEERKKIASVLHDSIAHDVLITKNWSEFGVLNAGDNEEYKRILRKISEQSSLTLNELRRIQFNLHPYEVEKLGLTKAIKSIVDRVSKSTEIKFTFEEDFIDKMFSEENEIHLYRVLQEGINNIIKHSEATKAGIRNTRTDENVFITISDNGKGFSLDGARRRSSMGLSGIAERVKLLGGDLDIDSESGNGTVLRISLPAN